MGINMLTEPEPVLSPSQWEAVYAAAMNGSSGGSSTEYHAHFDGVTYASHEAMTRRAFQQMDIGRSALARMGRRN
jgi:hypothetical protein